MPWLRLYDFYLLAVIALLETARRLPFLPLTTLWTNVLGVLALGISKAKRAEIKENLDIAFGEPTDARQREQLTARIFSLFWQELFAWALPDSHFVANTTILGLEYLHDALARGKGAILWESNGFGNRVAAQAILANNGWRVVPIHAYRHLGGISAGATGTSLAFERIIHPYFYKLERRRVTNILYLPQDASLSFTRTLSMLLSQNTLLCVAADGPRGHKYISVPFLGQPHNFATGMTSLAQLSGAPLLPLFCTPQAAGGYLLEILPPLPAPPPGSRTAQTAPLEQFLTLLEARIREHPEWYRHWDLLAPNRQSQGY